MKIALSLVCLLSLAAVRAQSVTQVCRQASSDLYLLMETTPTIGTANLRVVTSYLKTIFKNLNVAPERTRVSLTSFDVSVKNIANLNELQTLSAVNDVLDKLAVGRYGASLQEAIDFMSDNLFTAEHGRRTNKEAICVVFVGTRISPNIAESATRLRENCRVIVLGVGVYRYSFLTGLATEPSSKHIIYSLRPKDLKVRANSMLKSICTQPIGAPRAEVYDVQTKSVRIRWILQPFAIGYTANIRLLNSNKPLRTFSNLPRDQSEVKFEKLIQATTYVASIWAIGSDRKLGPKSVVFITTSIAPSEIQIDESSITSSSAMAFWEPNTAIKASYYVTFKAVNNRTDVISYPVIGAQTVVQGLSAGTTYTVTLATLSGGVRSKESKPDRFVTVPDPPMLKVRQVKLVSITLVWPPVKGAASHEITMKDVRNNVTSRHTNVTGTSFKIADLTPSRKYEFQALTVGRSGFRSVYSKLISVFTAPSNPDDVNLDFVTETSALIRWSSQPAAVGYRVFVRSDGHSSYQEERNTTETQLWMGNMLSGYVYVFSVYSVGDENVIDFNVVHPFHVQTVPSPPTDLVVINSTATGLELAWNASVGAKAYHVVAEKLVNGTASGDVVRTVNNTMLSALVEGLEPGFQYLMTMTTEGFQGAMSSRNETVVDSTLTPTPNQPRSLYVNMTLVELEIDPVERATGYVIEVESLESDGIREIEVTAGSDVAVDRLFPGVWYSMRVKSVNAFGKINPDASDPLLEQAVPAPPLQGHFKKVTTTSLQFRWPEVKGAISYMLYITSDDFDAEFTEPWSREIHSNETRYDVAGLRQGTLYEFRVQSIGHKDRKSSIGDPVFERTIPGSPQNVTKVGVTPSTISLRWNAVKGAKEYVVLRLSSFELEPAYIDAHRNQLLATELRTGSWFNFTVFSKDAKGRMNDKGSATIDVQTVPLAPVNIGLRDAMVDSYTVEWDEMWGAAAYRVRAETRDRDAKVKEVLVRVNASTRALVSGLDSGTRYRFRISAIGFQEQTSLETVPVVDTTLPLTPDRPTLDDVTTTSISVTWNEVKGASYFVVRVVQFTPGNNTGWEVRADKSSSVIDGLVSGGWYNLSVFSVGTRNRRNKKDSEIFQAQTIPLAPISITFTEVTTREISLKWNNVTGAGLYVISVRDLATDTLRENMESVQTSMVVSELEPGTKYAFQVTSVGEDEKRKSSRSSPLREETDPDTPALPAVSAVTTSSVKLDWGAVRGARRYIVRVTSPEDENVRELDARVNSQVIGGLLSGTLYSFSIFSVGKQNRRNELGSVNATVVTVPAQPQNVDSQEHVLNAIGMVTDQTAQTTEIGIIWKKVVGATSYEVTVTRRNEVVQTIDSITESVVVVGLVPGTEYQFRIVAVGRENRRSKPSNAHIDSTFPETPGAPTVTSVTETSISVEWPRVTGSVVSYTVFIQQEGSFALTDRGSVNTESTEIDGLQSGVRYTVQVQATGEGGKTSELSEAVVQQTVTMPPSNLKFTFVETDSIALEWTEARGASSYALTITTETDTSERIVVQTTTHIATNLDAGSRYSFSLRSIGDENRESSQTTDAATSTVPVTPTGVNAAEVSTDRVLMRWTSVKGALRYRIQATSTTEDRVPDVDDTADPEVAVRGLTPGGYYSISVFSIGEEDRVNEIGSDVVIVQTVPLPPSGFVLAGITTSEIEFSWESSYGASSYVFEISSSDDDIMFEQDDGTMTPTKQIASTGTSLIVTSLRAGTPYVITARSVAQQENRESAVVAAVDEYTVPARPSQPRTTTVSTTEIQLEWDDVKGAVRYDVTMESTEITQPATVSTENSAAQFGGLRPGGTYTFRVFSIGREERKNTEASDMLRVQTVTSAPENFVVDDVKTTSSQLSWQEVYGASSYVVKVLAVVDGVTSVVEETTVIATSYAATSLSPGTEHRFTVRSVGSDGSTESAESDVITRATLPEVVPSIMITEVLTSQVTFEWPQASGAKRYRVIIANLDNNTSRNLETDLTTSSVTELKPGTWYKFTVISIGDLEVTNSDPTVMARAQTIPNPPGQVDVDQVTTERIHLSWSNAVGADSYVVTVTLKTGDVVSSYSAPSGESPSLVIEALNPGTDYVITVKSVGAEGQSSAESAAAGDATLPATASGVSVVDITTTSATLRWQQVKGAQKYQVIYRVSGTLDVPNVLEVDATETEVRNLDDGTWYEFVVFSIGMKERRNEEGSEKIQLQTIPLAPVNLITSDVTISSLTLKWSDVKGAKSYRVEYGASGSDSTKVLDVSSTTADVDSLESGTSYWFIVKSVGEANQLSGASERIVETTVPGTPINARVTDVSSTSINLSWDDVKGALRYDISTSSSVSDEEYQSSSSSFELTGLQPGIVYTFRVFSVGIKERKNPEGSESVSQQTIPSAPSSVQLSSVTTTSVTASWDSVTGATSYVVVLSTDDVTVVIEQSMVTVQGTTSFALTTLVPGTEYLVAVKAVGSTNDLISAMSEKVRETTLPDTPINVNAVDVTTSTISVTWDAMKGAETYVITIQNSETGESEERTSSTSSAVLDSLLDGYWYEIVVFSVGIGGRRHMAGSDILRKQTVPSPPNDVRVTDTDVTSISLAWTDTKGTRSYTVRVVSDDASIDDVTLTSEETSLVVAQLLPGESYNFYVTAVGEESQLSAESEPIRDTTLPEAVSNIVISDVTTNAINIQWNQAKGANRYRVLLRNVDNDTSETHETTSISIAIGSLKPGSWFEFRVIAIAIAGTINSDKDVVASSQTVPLPPTNIDFTQINTNSLHLSWNHVHGASRYILSSSVMNGSEAPEIHNSTKPSIALTKLQAGTQYQITIKSVGTSGLVSDASHVVLESTRPAATSGLDVADVEVMSVTLRWQAVQGAENYQIFYHANGSDEAPDRIETTEAMIEVIGLEAGTWYNFVVYSVGTKGRRNEEGSETLQVQTVTALPNGLISTNVTTSSLTLQWNSVKGAARYRVEYGPTADEQENVIETVMTSADVTSLESGTRYWFVVKSIGEQSQISEESDAFQDVTVPSLPINITLTEVSPRNAVIAWSSVKGAVNYLLFLENSNGEQQTVQSIKASVKLTDLLPGVWYNLTITSVGIKNRTNPMRSQEFRFQTVPLAPINLSIVNVTTSSFDLSWSAVNGAAKYEISVTPGKNETVTDSIVTSNTFITIGSLYSGTNYGISIVTIGQEDQRSDSSKDIFEATLPVAPDAPTVVMVANSSIQLNWTSVKGAVSYIVEVFNSTILEATLTTSDSQISVTNLLPGFAYQMRVVSIDVKERTSAKSPFTTQQTVPSAPNHVMIDQVTTNSLSITWEKVVGASEYYIWLSQVRQKKIETISNFSVETIQHNLVSLMPGREYRIAVSSVGSDISLQSGRSEIVVSATLPEAVSSVEAINPTTTSITTTWSKSKGASRYEVVIRNVDNETQTSVATSAESFTFDDLTPGTWYEFNVISVGDLNTTNLDTSVSVRKQTVPLPPTKIDFTQINTNSLHLSWNHVHGASQYILSSSVMNGSEAPEIHNSSKPSIALTKLQAGTQYQITIKSVGTSGLVSDASHVVLESTRPAATSSLDVAHVEVMSVTLRWQAVQGAENYQIFYRANGSDEAPDRIETTETMIEVIDLEAGTWYNFVVYSVGTKGRRNEEGSETLQVQTVTASPDGLASTNVTTSSLNIQWNSVKGAARYRVEFGPTADEQENVIETVMTSVDVISLESGTRYWFVVKSIGEQSQISEESDAFQDVTVPSLPINITLTEVSPRNAVIAWSSAKGAKNYLLFLENSNGEQQTVQSIKASVKLTDLLPGVWYNLTITSVGIKNRTNPMRSQEFRFQTVPLAPINLSIVNVTTSSFHLSWKAVNGAAKYEISVTTEDNVTVTDSIVTSNTFFTIGSLYSGTNYGISIVTIGQEDQRSDSSEDIFEATLPASPDAPTVVMVANTSIDLYWLSVKGAVSYIVEVFNSTILEATLTTSDSQISVTNLLPGFAYQMRVVSIDVKERTSAKSPFTTQQTVPSAPNHVMVDQVTTNSLSITWEKVVGASEYYIWLSQVRQKKIETISNFSVETIQHNLVSLMPGREYRIAVSSVGSDISLQSERSEIVVSATLPKAVSSVEAINPTTTLITTTWSKSKGASRYEVVIRNVDNETQTSVATSAESFTFDDLTPGTWYEFNVISVGDLNTTNLDTSVSVRKQTVPLPPTKIDFTQINTNSLHLSWNHVHGASRYILSSSVVNGSEAPEIHNSTKPSIALTKLQAGTQYQITIKSVGTSGLVSDASHVVLESTRPAATSGLDVADVEVTSVTLRWEAVQGAENYQIFYHTNGSDEAPDRIETTETMIEVIGLEAGTWYNFVVYSVGTKGRRNEEGSETLQVQTVTASPDGLTSTNVTTSSLNIQWNSVKGAARYRVEFGPTADEQENVIETVMTSVDVISLESGTRYWFVVKSIGEQSQISEESDTFQDVTVPSLPTNIALSDVTSRTATITWASVKGAQNYLLFLENSNGEQQTVQSIKASVKLTDLLPGVWYNLTMTSVGIKNRTNPMRSQEFRFQTVPLAPINLSIVNVTTSSFDLSWSAVYGAAKYEISVTTEDSATVTDSIVTSNTFFTIGSLYSGTNYGISIVTIGQEDQRSDSSEDISEATLPAAPDAPTVVMVANSSIDLNWISVKGAASYIVEVFNSTILEAIFATSDSQISITSLLPGIAYQMRVVSVDVKERTSAKSSFTTQQTVPSAPSHVMVDQITTSSLSITWKKVVGASDYFIWLSQVRQNKIETISNFSVETTQHNLISLMPGRKYRIAVSSVGSDVSLQSERSETVVGATLPEAVSSIEAINATTTSITVTWSKAKGASDYEVVIRNLDNGARKTITTGERFLIVDELTPGTWYELHVISVGDLNATNFDSAVSVQKQTVPLPPSDVEVSNVTTSSLLLSWKASHGASSYRVSVTTTSKDLIRQLLTSNVTSLLVTSLRPGTEYDINVRSVGEEEQVSASSVEVREVTKPEATGDLEVVDVTTTSAFLRWQKVQGAEKYRVFYRERNDTGAPHLVETFATEVEISGLVAGTWYEVVVFSVAMKGRTNEEGKATVQLQTVPLPPDTVATSDVTPVSVQLRWSKVSGAAKYLVEYTSSTSNTRKSIETVSSFVDISMLESGTMYLFTVKSIGEQGRISAASEKVPEITVPAVPGAPNIVDVTTTSVSLEWKPTQGAMSYQVRVTLEASTQVIDTLTVSANRVRFDNLKPGLVYNFTVFAVGVSGQLNDEQSSTVTQQTVTAAPTNFEVTDVTSTTASASWNSVLGASNYTARIQRSDLVATVEEIVTLDTSIVWRNLEPGVSYAFTVNAVNHANLTSAPASAIEQQTTPIAPEAISVSRVTANSVDLEWKSATGAENYRVDVLTNEGLLLKSERATSDSAAVSNLKPGLIYSFHVYSVGSSGRINETSKAAVTQQTVLSAPTNLAVGEVSSTTMTLSWDVVTGASQYLVSVRNDESPDVEEMVVLQTSLELKDLSPGVLHRFVVRATTQENLSSEPSAEVAEQTIPTAPESVAVSDVTTTTISLTWTKATGSVDYRVDVFLSDSNTFLRSEQSSSTSITVSNLQAGERYTFRVFSIGLKSRIDESSSVSTTQQTVSAAPGIIQVEAVTTDAIVTSWNPVKGATSYIATYYETADRGTSVDLTATEPEIALDGLPPATSYVIFVRAVNTHGHISKASESITEMTMINPPENVVVVGASQTSASLTWNAVKGSSSYVIEVVPDITDVTFQVVSSTAQRELSGLTPGSRYVFRVASIDTKGRQSSGWSQSVVANTVPLPPKNIKTESVTPESFVITWESVKGAVRYDVRILLNEAETSFQETSETQVTLSGLEVGTSYTCLLRSVNIDGAQSDAARIEQQTASLAPLGLTASLIRPSFIDILWETSKGAASYDVVVTEVNSGKRSVTLSFDKAIATVGNLLSGTLYRFSVFSVTNSNLRSLESASLIHQTRTDAPRNVSAVGLNQTAIEVTWNRVRGAASYTVYVTSIDDGARKAKSDREQRIEGLTSLSVIVDELLSGVNYTFQVSAIGMEGLESDPSDPVTQQTYSLTPILPFTGQPLVTISNVSQMYFEASWQEILYAVAYKIILRGGGDEREILVEGKRSTKIDVDNLFPDTSYNVTLKAIGAAREETEESVPPAKARTKPFPPRPPTAVRADLIRATYVLISWTKMPRALKYDVIVFDDDSKSTRTIRNVPRTSFNVTNLRHRGNFIVTVTSVGKLEKSRPSEAVTFETRHPAPVMPRNLARPNLFIRSVTFDSFVVRLSPIEHAVSYDVILRAANQPIRTISDVKALTTTPITGLQQNTLYDVTYAAVGREGDKSEESDMVKTRTRRLVPGAPGDFQVLQVTPEKVVVTWQPALRAIGYRVTAQNIRTGRVTTYRNARAPFSATGLRFRDTYQLSVTSEGRYFDSPPSLPISVEIPYPGAANVTGAAFSQTTQTGFLLSWSPTPFASSYQVVIAIGNRQVQRIMGVPSNQLRVTGLKARTSYNVTVLAVSSDGTIVASNDWKTVRTASGLTPRGTVSATEDPTSRVLESAVVAFLEVLQEIPEAVSEGENQNGAGTSEYLNYQLRLRDQLEQLKVAVNAKLSRNAARGRTQKSARRRRQSQNGNAAFESLHSIAREIKSLKESRDATQSTVQSLSDRLSLSLSVALTSPSATSPLRDATQSDVRSVLRPILKQKLELSLLKSPPAVVVTAIPLLMTDRILPAFAPARGLTSTGFRVIWSGYQNVHRYKLIVTKAEEGRSLPVFEGLHTSRSVYITDLEPETTYRVIIRPTTLRGDVISGVAGRLTVTTRKARESNLNVTVTSTSSSQVKLVIQQFPQGVSTLLFQIRRKNTTPVVQRFLITRRHKTVTFGLLQPNMEYVITAQPVTSTGSASFEKTVRTLPESAIAEPSRSLAPPLGLRKVSSAVRSVTLEWEPVQLADTSPASIRYNVRLFRVGTPVLSRLVRYQQNTRVTVTRLTHSQYDVTVSTFNVRSRKESQQSPILRINLNDA